MLLHHKGGAAPTHMLPFGKKKPPTRKSMLLTRLNTPRRHSRNTANGIPGRSL